MNERDAMLEALQSSGGDRRILDDPDIAHLVVSGRHVASARPVPGLTVEPRETAEGIEARVRLGRGARLERPVHLCFGVLHRRGSQRIVMDVRLESGSAAHFIAHCLFPEAQQVRHLMDAVVVVGPGAELRYSETHLHGPYGGIEVRPRAQVTVAEGGRYFGDFSLTSGRVGELEIDYAVEVGAGAVSELLTRVFGRGRDVLRIREKIVLSGENARGLIKSRIALADDARAEVTGITEGRAAGARGHVDCMELVRDRAVASAVPIVEVTHPEAKVTHEAAIGSVDQRQLETLMAHGLTPEEAVDVIVTGILS
jgi:Fe-S cluster assembly scaffold protein SufB